MSLEEDILAQALNQQGGDQGQQFDPQMLPNEAPVSPYPDVVSAQMQPPQAPYGPPPGMNMLAAILRGQVPGAVDNPESPWGFSVADPRQRQLVADEMAHLARNAATGAYLDQLDQARAKQKNDMLKAVSGLDPQLQAAVLKRAGIDVGDFQSKEARAAKTAQQQILLKHQLEAPDRAANLELKQQEAANRQQQAQGQLDIKDQLLELRRQSVLGQQAQQLQKLQDMVALIPPTDPRRKVLEELILNSTMRLLPQLMGAQGAQPGTEGGDQTGGSASAALPNPNNAPLQGPKITVRRIK